MRALTIEGLCKSFGGLQAVGDVSLNLGTGEHLAIIGPNGAGKTTLFNLITGLLRPDTGRIWIFDQEVTNRPTYYRARIGLGRTFQVTNLLPSLTVVKNVLLALQAHRPSRFGMYRPLSAYGQLLDEARKLMTPWGLWESRDMPVRDLSYGQQRCLEVILSLAAKPRLLLLDEPTCGMTPEEVAGITSMIQTLGKGIALIIIAHDMDLIFGLDLDRITVLHFGTIVAEGTKEEIKADPRVRDIYLGQEWEEASASAG